MNLDKLSRLAVFTMVILVAGISASLPGTRSSAEWRLSEMVASGRVDPAIAETVREGGEADAVVVLAGRNLPENDLAEALGPGHVVRIFGRLGVAHVRFDGADALTAVARHALVAAVRVNSVTPAATVQSLPLINQPAAASSGFRGDGVTVAVLDTGGNCPQIPNVDGECPVVWAEDFAEDDGEVDDDGHGTNVAGIVSSVAPGAKIASLDVFTRNASGGLGAQESDVFAAIDAIIERQAELNIVAANLSLGSSQVRHLLECSIEPYTPVFAALREAGVTPVVAAGNQPLSAGFIFFDGVAYPACTPGALVVGAVYDSEMGPQAWPAVDPLDIFGLLPRSACNDAVTGPGVITCFSQTGALLDVFAPGAYINAAGLTSAGTSQATPHVAGAVAVLAAAVPSSTLEQREAAIRNSGPNIFDARNGITRRILELCGALSEVGAACGGTTLSLDRQAVPEDGWRYYYIDLEAAAGLLSVTTSAADGDVDVYLRRGSKPTPETAACAADGESGNETCTVAAAAAGRWWVGVYGFEDASFSIDSSTSSVTFTHRVLMPGVAAGP
jgi:subtilisin family serine protease